MVDSNTAEPCTKLFMFARSQTLNMRITPDPNQNILPRAVGKTYNQRLHTLRKTTLHQIESFLQNQDRIQAARNHMKRFRKEMRMQIRTSQGQLQQSQATTTPSPGTPGPT